MRDFTWFNYARFERRPVNRLFIIKLPAAGSRELNHVKSKNCRDTKMKRNISVICVILFLILPLSPAGTAVNYTSYVNNNYNYEIIIPGTWKKKESTSKENHLMYASIDANTDIKVRAFRSKDNGIEKTVHSTTWDLRKIDPGLHKIIETGNIRTQKKVTGKLLIFEYRLTGNSFLQRALITQNNGIIYIVECRSPETTFYKYDDIFTIAFASFRFLEQGVMDMSSRQKLKQEPQEEEEKLEEITDGETKGNEDKDPGVISDTQIEEDKLF